MESKFIDVHAHVSSGTFDQIRKRVMNGIRDLIILNSGENPEENARIFEDALKYAGLLPCVGLHPNYVSYAKEKELAESMEYMRANTGRAFAVSEIGLDYKEKTEQQKGLQRKVFTELLEAAETNNKVCIVHSRKAIDDVLKILSSFKSAAIIHNFEGNQAQCAKACELGISISISTGFMKFKRDNLIKKIPLERLFLETDSPALSPDSEINTPLNIHKILNYVAGLRDMDGEELKEKVFENFKKVFHA